MRFEIKLEGRLSVWALRSAGLVVDEYQKLFFDVLDRKASLPGEVGCPYIFSDAPISARITVRSFGQPVADLTVEVDDNAIGQKIQEKLVHYSEENRGQLVANKERDALWKKIDGILERSGITRDQLDRQQATHTRDSLRSLMKLCEEVPHPRQGEVIHMFWKPIAKADRTFVARWLVNFFANERDPFERAQIGVNLDKLAVPEIADDLIRLIKDQRYGWSRSGLCAALVKTKDSRAAEVIASVLAENEMSRWALEALGKLKASQHVVAVRIFLRHPNADVRREAKKTLKKLGFPVEIPPPPVHLVKNRRLLPEGLEEWSTDLDIEDLNPTLEALAKCVEAGFNKQEIAEINGVVDEMKHDQTKTFCFPINVRGQNSEAWVELFMDDIDSPDLAIYARAELIQKLSSLLPERE